jgi:hypothetical protein
MADQVPEGGQPTQLGSGLRFRSHSDEIAFLRGQVPLVEGDGSASLLALDAVRQLRAQIEADAIPNVLQLSDQLRRIELLLETDRPT